jgi:ketosteroid isomerase-like protein
MSRENVEIVRLAYVAMNDAYATAEFTAAVERFCHPDIVLKTSGLFPETGEYRGHAGVRQFVENQAEAFQQMSVHPLEFIDAGEKVVVAVWFGGRARHTGIQAEFLVAHIWTIRAARVARMDMYRSRDEALAAVRSPGARS